MVVGKRAGVGKKILVRAHLGSRKQKADTRCMKGAVGPPWCHALRIIPLDLGSTGMGRGIITRQDMLDV